MNKRERRAARKDRLHHLPPGTSIKPHYDELTQIEISNKRWDEFINDTDWVVTEENMKEFFKFQKEYYAKKGW